MRTVPAFLAACVTGGLLGAAGCVLQRVFRNPLAEPYMLGTVGGAALFAVAAAEIGWCGAAGAFATPLAAFAGALVSLGFVCGIAYAAARRRPALLEAACLNAPGNTVVLAGFVTGSLTGSLQMLLLSYAKPGTFEALSKWLFGDLRHVTPGMFAGACAVLALTLLPLVRRAPQIDLLALGADRAACLGIDVRRLLFVTVGLAAFATATAVATAGAVGFVGLVAPHLARRLAGARFRVLLPCAATVGAALLSMAEWLADALPGSPSPGVVCAVFGAPWFLFLLVWKR